MTTPQHADLSDRAIFQLTGPDAVTYLNGQISQDVRLTQQSKSAYYSVISNFKGKLEGDFYIREHNGNILIDTDASQRDTLLARLDKYLIADDAEFTDVTDQYNLYFTTSTEALEYPTWESSRYGVTGHDILTPVSTKLFNDSCDNTTQWQAIRIANKIPQWGAELHGDILPADAALDDRAISYTKGCYTGQEVISRMKSSGKTNRHLVNFTLEQPLPTPTDLYLDTTDKKPSATLTSITQQADGSYLALGYRTRKAELKEHFFTLDNISVNVS